MRQSEQENGVGNHKIFLQVTQRKPESKVKEGWREIEERGGKCSVNKFREMNLLVIFHIWKY